MARRLEIPPRYTWAAMALFGALFVGVWWVAAQRNGIHQAFETRLVVAGPGRLTRTDHVHSLEWQAGVPVLGRWRASGEGGRVWRYQRRVELGVGPDGVSTPVDLTFSTAVLDRPLAELLPRAGWSRPRLGAEARGALLVAGGVVVVGLIAPLVVLVSTWLGG